MSSKEDYLLASKATPTKIEQYIAKAAQANTKAFLLQTRFLEDLVTLNGSAFNELADDSVNSLQKMTEARSFMEAFENSLNQGAAFREKMQTLFKDSKRAFEDLQYELKEVYIGDGEMLEQAREFTEDSIASVKEATETMFSPAMAAK